jgi:hypothetical protein
MVKQARNLGEKDRGVVGYTRVDGLPGALADEKGVVAKVLLELFRGIGSHAEGPDAKHLGVEEGLGIGLDVTDEALDEVLGLGTGRADEYGVAPVDALKGCFLGCEFIGELLSPVFKGVHGSSLFSLDRLIEKPKCCILKVDYIIIRYSLI